MTELTRDEIRRACIAVGWDQVKSLGLTFSPNAALALMQATGCAFKIHYVPGREEPWWVSWDVPSPRDPMWIPGATLTDAAIRAVLAWAETKAARP